jgi:putative Mn2+ efflux pump MntP
LFLFYGCYKIWEGIKRGKKFTNEQKANSKRTITRFVIGVAIGLYTGAVVVWMLMLPEHERMHEILEQHGIEVHEH